MQKDKLLLLAFGTLFIGILFFGLLPVNVDASHCGIRWGFLTSPADSCSTVGGAYCDGVGSDVCNDAAGERFPPASAIPNLYDRCELVTGTFFCFEVDSTKAVTKIESFEIQGPLPGNNSVTDVIPGETYTVTGSLLHATGDAGFGGATVTLQWKNSVGSWVDAIPAGSGTTNQFGRVSITWTPNASSKAGQYSLSFEGNDNHFFSRSSNINVTIVAGDTDPPIITSFTAAPNNPDPSDPVDFKIIATDATGFKETIIQIDEDGDFISDTGKICPGQATCAFRAGPWAGGTTINYKGIAVDSTAAELTSETAWKNFTVSNSVLPDLTVTAAPVAVPADGSSNSTLTAQTSDNMSGVVVTFTASLGTLSTNTCTTGGTGSCTVTISSNSAGTSNIGVENAGYSSGSGSVNFGTPIPLCAGDGDPDTNCYGVVNCSSAPGGQNPTAACICATPGFLACTAGASCVALGGACTAAGDPCCGFTGAPGGNACGPIFNTCGVDTDGDGYSDDEETNAGTDPGDELDFPVIGPPGPTLPPAVNLEFKNPIGATSFSGLVNSIIDFIFTISLIVAPILLVIAGVIFMTAAGDPGKVATARRMLLWTIVGFGIIIVSKGLVEVIKAIIGVSTSS